MCNKSLDFLSGKGASDGRAERPQLLGLTFLTLFFDLNTIEKIVNEMKCSLFFLKSIEN